MAARLIIFLLVSSLALRADDFVYVDNFVHPTDVHLGRVGGACDGTNLTVDLQQMEALDPSFGIQTGDMTDLGSTSSYQQWTNQVATNITFVMWDLMGNHDDSSFWTVLKKTNHWSFTNESMKLAFIGFNSTLRTNEDEFYKWGEVSNDEVLWVSNRTVEARSGNYAVIYATHFRIQQDTIGSTNPSAIIQPIRSAAGGSALTNIMRMYNVQLCITGHEHDTNLWYTGSTGFTNLVGPCLCGSVNLWANSILDYGAFNNVLVYTNSVNTNLVKLDIEMIHGGAYTNLHQFDRSIVLTRAAAGGASPPAPHVRTIQTPKANVGRIQKI